MTASLREPKVCAQPPYVSADKEQSSATEAARLAILKVASPNRKRCAAARAAQREGEDCSPILPCGFCSNEEAAPPLPDMLAQLDRNFESMNSRVAMCMQGLDNVWHAQSVTASGSLRHSISGTTSELVEVAQRIDKEMAVFFTLLSASVDAPTVAMLQKLHSTIMEVAQETAARPVIAQPIMVPVSEPPDLDKLLAAVSAQRPALAREITYTTAASLKFEYIQACARRSGPQRRQEVWQALSTEEKKDIAELPGLAICEQHEFVLNVVEQDRLQRYMHGEMGARTPQQPQPEAAETVRSSTPVRSLISVFERTGSASAAARTASMEARMARAPTAALSSFAWPASESHQHGTQILSCRSSVASSSGAPPLPIVSSSGAAPPITWHPRMRHHAPSPSPLASPQRTVSIGDALAGEVDGVQAGTVRDRIRILHSNGLHV